MSEIEVSNETKIGVQYEDVLEMLGGYNYFSQAQIMYIYHKFKFSGRTSTGIFRTITSRSPTSSQ